MLMAAADLLRPPRRRRTAQTVMDALGGVLCRCTGYLKIVDAVLDAAQTGRGREIEPKLRDPRSGTVASGSACSGSTAPPSSPARPSTATTARPPDALWLKAVRSPHATRVLRSAISAPFLARHPGIVRVFTAADVPGENSFGIYPDLKDQPVFAEGHVRHRGEPVLAIVGTREAVEAVDAADLPIAWEPLPALARHRRRRWPTAPRPSTPASPTTC